MKERSCSTCYAPLFHRSHLSDVLTKLTPVRWLPAHLPQSTMPLGPFFERQEGRIRSESACPSMYSGDTWSHRNHASRRSRLLHSGLLANFVLVGSRVRVSMHMSLGCRGAWGGHSLSPQRDRTDDPERANLRKLARARSDGPASSCDFEELRHACKLAWMSCDVRAVPWSARVEETGRESASAVWAVGQSYREGPRHGGEGGACRWINVAPAKHGYDG